MERKEPVIGVIGLGGESVFLSVDHFHAPGETLQARDLFVEAGGKGYNQAVAAARLGAKVCYFGAVGQDAGGALCRQVLQQEGVVPVLQVIPHRNTAYACILTNAEGENRVTVSRGAADDLSADFMHQQEGVVANCTHLLLGLEYPMEATVAALAMAKKYGIYTIFNPAPAIPLDLDFLRGFDLITPNLQEATVLLGLSDVPRIQDLGPLFRQAGLCNVVVTLGSEGALLITAEKQLLYPGILVTAVDTTGAGDTFNAALVVAMGRGESLEQAMEYAINASALSVSGSHVMQSLPTQAQVQEFYRSVTPVPL